MSSLCVLNFRGNFNETPWTRTDTQKLYNDGCKTIYSGIFLQVSILKASKNIFLQVGN